MSGAPAQNNQIVGSDGEFANVGDGTSKRLYDGEVSNKKYLNISWISSEDDFKVASVNAYFYPITFELYDSDGNLNLNYPYSPNVYQTFNLMEETTTETIGGVTRTRSADVNLVQDSRYNELSTVQGMYKVVRTYVNPNVEDAERTYYFYIDRNNLISYDESFNISDNYIGNYIELMIGDSSNQFTFTGSDFLQEFVTKYISLYEVKTGKNFCDEVQKILCS